MTKYIILALSILLSTSFYAQELPAVFKLKENINVSNKITLATIHNDKEIIQPTEITDDGTIVQPRVNTHIYPIQTVELTKKAVCKLSSMLSYSKGEVAASGHYDIEINCYKNDSIISIIRISSIMKIISIQNTTIQCESSDNENKTECYFLGPISKQLQHYLEKLLKKKEIWNSQQYFYNW